MFIGLPPVTQLLPKDGPIRGLMSPEVGRLHKTATASSSKKGLCDARLEFTLEPTFDVSCANVETAERMVNLADIATRAESISYVANEKVVRARDAAEGKCVQRVRISGTALRHRGARGSVIPKTVHS